MEQAIMTSNCSNCGHILSLNSKYCNKCGVAIGESEMQSKQGSALTLIIAFYVIEVIVCALVTFNDSFSGMKSLLIADAIMAVCAICFFISIWTNVKELLKWKSISAKKILLYTTIAIGASCLVQLLSFWLNRSLFDRDTQFYYAFAHYDRPLLAMILVIGLYPALFEELAYRGFLMGGLIKVLDSKQAMFISTFLFALIHLSIISFFWLFPFALFLAYVRKKENTIWYGVLIHFVFNSCACIVELYKHS
jgi:membrane protease YdiL (CAAX protease family)